AGNGALRAAAGAGAGSRCSGCDWAAAGSLPPPAAKAIRTTTATQAPTPARIGPRLDEDFEGRRLPARVRGREAMISTDGAPTLTASRPARIHLEDRVVAAVVARRVRERRVLDANGRSAPGGAHHRCVLLRLDAAGRVDDASAGSDESEPLPQERGLRLGEPRQ